MDYTTLVFLVNMEANKGYFSNPQAYTPVLK